MNDIVKATLESKVTEKAYDDVLSPGFKELGKLGQSAAKTARLLLAPLQIAATFQDRFERFLEKLGDRVPEERRLDVPPEIAGPAMEAMRYLDDGTALWGMFSELLMKAADRDFVGLVHPSFAYIVKQLTRDEALLLDKLRTQDFKITDTMSFNRGVNRFENLEIESSTIPKDELLNPDAVGIYYSHLESLSLVRWPVTKQDPIMHGGVQIGIRRCSVIHLTEFGRLFVQACTTPVERENGPKA